MAYSLKAVCEKLGIHDPIKVAKLLLENGPLGNGDFVTGSGSNLPVEFIIINKRGFEKLLAIDPENNKASAARTYFNNPQNNLEAERIAIYQKSGYRVWMRAKLQKPTPRFVAADYTTPLSKKQRRHL